MICGWCNEKIEPRENGERTDIGTHHPDCALRAVIGSVAHLQRRCACYVRGSSDNDPDGMTKREAATAAANLFRRLSELGVYPFNERVRGVG